MFKCLFAYSLYHTHKNKARPKPLFDLACYFYLLDLLFIVSNALKISKGTAKITVLD